MKIASGMEVARFSNNLFLEFILIHVDGWLDEHNRRRSAGANHDALGDHVAAHSTSVVFDGLGIASKTALRFDPIVISATGYVPSWAHLLEEVTSVEVTICVSKDSRAVW